MGVIPRNADKGVRKGDKGLKKDKRWCVIKQVATGKLKFNPTGVILRDSVGLRVTLMEGWVILNQQLYPPNPCLYWFRLLLRVLSLWHFWLVPHLGQVYSPIQAEDLKQSSQVFPASRLQCEEVSARSLWVGLPRVPPRFNLSPSSTFYYSSLISLTLSSFYCYDSDHFSKSLY